MKDCSYCGKRFEPRVARQVYCKENCRKRSADDRHRGTCRECGKPLGTGSAWDGRQTARCQDCERKLRRARVEERAIFIVAWWRQGVSLEEIAERLGWKRNHLGVEIARLRRKGYPLPYRKPRHKPLHPEQVK